MQVRVHGPVYDYITRTFVREPAWAQAARAKGEELRPGMQVSSYEGYLLQWITRIAGAKKILEIGTFMGTSAMWLAEGAGEGGQVTTLEFDENYAALARAHIAASPQAKNIEVVRTDAAAWLARSPEKPTYDLVFIDADKTGYGPYLDAVLPRMNKRGFIIGDNTLLFGAMTGEHPDGASAATKASMAYFNETLADSTRFEGIMLPTFEGLTVARMK